MKKLAFFEDAPKGKVTIIEDFLPPPSQLVRKQETVRVTSEFTQQQYRIPVSGSSKGKCALCNYATGSTFSGGSPPR